MQTWEKYCLSALNKTGIPGYQYCANPYTGCEHRCVYCYADFMRRFSGHHGERWGEFVDVKVNFIDVLQKQLESRKKLSGRVIFGSVTDCYQPLEDQYQLMRGSLKLFIGHPELEVNILTKSDLVLRDIDFLQQIPHCRVGLTITTADDQITGVVEPKAAPASSRLKALNRLHNAGIETWAFIAPILPGIADSESALTSLLSALHQAGVTEVMADTLTRYPTVINRLRTLYRSRFPQQLEYLNWYLSDSVSYQRHLGDLINRCGAPYGYSFDQIC